MCSRISATVGAGSCSGFNNYLYHGPTTPIYAYIYIYIYVFICVYMCIYICVYICSMPYASNILQNDVGSSKTQGS